MKRLLYLIVFLVVALFAFTLNFKNPDTILINYYFDIEWNVPLFVVLVAPFFVGMLLGILLMSVTVLKSKHQAGQTKRNLVKVEKEVQNLRAMPIKDEV